MSQPTTTPRVGRTGSREVARLRGKIGMATLRGRPDEEARYRRLLGVQVLTERIDATLGSPYSPTPEQRRALADRLLSGLDDEGIPA